MGIGGLCALPQPQCADIQAFLLKIKAKKALGDKSLGEVFIHMGSVFGEDEAVIKGNSFLVRRCLVCVWGNKIMEWGW